jgi:hypothetical protein
MATVPNYEIERLNEFVAEIEIAIKEHGYAYAYGATMFNLKSLLNQITREPAPWENL